MKAVVLALFVLLAVSQSEALRCYCGGSKTCPSPEETCSDPNDVCTSAIIYTRPKHTYYKSCLPEYRCKMLTHPGVSDSLCCKTDLCNYQPVLS